MINRFRLLYYWNTRLWLVSIVIYVILLFGLHIITYVPNKENLSYWEQDTKKYIEINSQLYSLTNEFGYGGFIHDFKNYVIRREKNYLIGASESLKRTQILLRKLEKKIYFLDNAESFVAVQNTVDEYQGKVNWVSQNLSTANVMSVAELDTRVKVDDSHAFQALDLFASKSQKLLSESIEKSERLSAELLTKVMLNTLFVTIIYWLATLRLVNLLKKSRQQFEQLKVINQYAPIAFLIINRNGNCIAANEKFRTLFELPKISDISVYNVENFMPESKRNLHKNVREGFVAQGRVAAMGERSGNVQGQTLNGRKLALKISIISLNDDMPGRAMAIIQDVSSEVKLVEKSTTDYLTNIPNRLHAEQQVQSELDRVKRYGGEGTFALLDIDHFKSVNDSLGHDMGDKVLIALVNIFKSNLRSTDYIARWGGDEFVVLLPNTPLLQGKETFGKMIQVLENTIMPHGDPITVSIGLSKISPKVSYIELFKQSDAALLLAKDFGRNRIQMHSSDND